jgi:hypothetical protein
MAEVEIVGIQQLGQLQWAAITMASRKVHLHVPLHVLVARTVRYPDGSDGYPLDDLQVLLAHVESNGHHHLLSRWLISTGRGGRWTEHAPARPVSP